MDRRKRIRDGGLISVFGSGVTLQNNKLGLAALTETRLITAGLGNIGPFRFSRAEIYKLAEDEANKIEELINI